MKNDKISIERILEDNGCRDTRPRRRVLEMLLEHKAPVTVSEIHEKLASSSIDLVSVYRSINLFLKEGILVAVDSVAEGKRYELSDRYREHHHHLICQDCGKVEDIEDCFIEKMQKAISRKVKFKIRYHDLKFLGLCQACSA